MSTLREALAEYDAAIERRSNAESLIQEADRLSKDFRAFVYAAWPLLGFIPLVPAFHIDAIAEHVQAAYERFLPRLVVTVPPGYLKSSIISVLAPAWLWTRYPHDRIVSASHSDELATRDTRRSRALMLNPWYTNRWGNVFAFTGDENLKTRYSNDQGGHRVRTHVGGGTGDRGSILQLDDPHNAQEAHSDVMLQSAKDWWGETWASRLDDSVEARGVKIVIGQRISEEDLIGHLLANDEDAGRWTHLCLPVQYERAHPFVYPAKVKLRNGKTITGDKRRKEGQLLAPAYMDDERLADKTSDMSAHTFAGQYQQRPAPREGLLLKRAHWRYYEPELSFYSPRETFGPAHVAELASRVGPFSAIVHSWDTSLKDRAKSDYVSGQVWGCIGAYRYLLRLYHERAGLNATVEAMMALSNWATPLWPHVPHHIVIENSANGPDAAAEIRSRVYGVVLADAKGSKEARAEAAEPALAGHNCFLPGYPKADGSTYDDRTPAAVQRFVEELAVFNQGANDDQVDGWSSMVLWTRNRSGEMTMSVPTGQVNPPRFRTEQQTTALRPALR